MDLEHLRNVLTSQPEDRKDDVVVTVADVSVAEHQTGTSLAQHQSGTSLAGRETGTTLAEVYSDTASGGGGGGNDNDRMRTSQSGLP